MYTFKVHKAVDGKLQSGEASITSIPERHVVVKIHAVGVNRADILVTRGKYVHANSAEVVPGLEFAGVVLDAKGTGRKFFSGERVCGLCASGAFAEMICIHEDLLMRLPDSASFVDGASVPESWGTAWFNLVRNGNVRKDEHVLIHSAGGGVGLAAIQIAHDIGATVVATCGTKEKIEKLESLGVSHIHNYREQPLETLVDEYDSNINLILDTIGGSALKVHLSLLSTGGRLLLIGLLGGASGELDLARLLRKNGTIIARTLRSQAVSEKHEICKYIESYVFPRLENRYFHFHRDEIFSFREPEKAFSYILSNKNFGNVVLSLE
jgi:NADPH:quinone reductase